MGPPAGARGSSPGLASAKRGRPWPASRAEAPEPQFVTSRRERLTLLLLEESRPQGSNNRSDDTREGHETLYFLKREALALKFHLGGSKSAAGPRNRLSVDSRLRPVPGTRRAVE